MIGNKNRRTEITTFYICTDYRGDKLSLFKRVFDIPESQENPLFVDISEILPKLIFLKFF